MTESPGATKGDARKTIHLDPTVAPPTEYTPGTVAFKVNLTRQKTAELLKCFKALKSSSGNSDFVSNLQEIVVMCNLVLREGIPKDTSVLHACADRVIQRLDEFEKLVIPLANTQRLERHLKKAALRKKLEQHNVQLRQDVNCVMEYILAAFDAVDNAAVSPPPASSETAPVSPATSPPSSLRNRSPTTNRTKLALNALVEPSIKRRASEPGVDAPVAEGHAARATPAERGSAVSTVPTDDAVERAKEYLSKLGLSVSTSTTTLPSRHTPPPSAVPSSPPPQESELTNQLREIAKLQAGDGGEASDDARLWKQLFGISSMIEWSRFVSMLAAFVGIEISPAEERAMQFIIDNSATGAVTNFKFLEFMKGFGPAKQCTRNIREILTASWFHGFLSKEETFKLLHGFAPGTFLIRFSNSRPGSFVLSFVQPNSEVLEILITRAHSGLPYRIEEDNSFREFSSLSQVISFYSAILKEPLNNSLLRDSWFWGDINREEANEILAERDIGTFLIRFSSKIGSFAVAYVMADPNAPGGRRTEHVLVDKHPSGAGFVTSGIQCSSLADVVSKFSNMLRTPADNTSKEFYAVQEGLRTAVPLLQRTAPSNGSVGTETATYGVLRSPILQTAGGATSPKSGSFSADMSTPGTPMATYGSFAAAATAASPSSQPLYGSFPVAAKGGSVPLPAGDTATYGTFSAAGMMSTTSTLPSDALPSLGSLESAGPPPSGLGVPSPFAALMGSQSPPATHNVYGSMTSMARATSPVGGVAAANPVSGEERTTEYCVMPSRGHPNAMQPSNMK